MSLFLKTEELPTDNMTELKDNELFNAMEDGITPKRKIASLNALNYDNNYSSEDENLVILNMNMNTKSKMIPINQQEFK